MLVKSYIRVWKNNFEDGPYITEYIGDIDKGDEYQFVEDGSGGAVYKALKDPICIGPGKWKIEKEMILPF